MHVRLQTIGVTEHAFDISLGGNNYNWMLYDVGGAVRATPLPLRCLALLITLAPGGRSASTAWSGKSRPSQHPSPLTLSPLEADWSICSLQRHAWVPFFDDGE